MTSAVRSSGPGLEALVQLSSALARAETVTHVCERGLAVVEQVLGVDRASVLLFDGTGGMRFRAWSGLSDAYRAATDGHSPWAPDTLDARPVVVEDVERDPNLAELREVVLAEGIRALAFVPISFDRRVLGKYMLYFPEPRTLADDELKVALLVADHIALAIKRQRDEAALRTSRDQLQAIFSGVTDAITVQGPDWELVYANEAAARFLGVESAAELLELPVAEVAGRFEMFDENRLPLDPAELPARQVFAGAPFAERLVGYRVRATGEERWSLVKASPVPGEGENARLIVNIIQDVTLSRRRAAWQSMLGEASAILAESLVSEAALERVANLAVPELADWCAVHLPGEPVPRLVALAHRDAARRRLALELVERYPADPAAKGGSAWVLRTGESVLIEDIDDDVVAAAAVDHEHARLIRALALRSAMIVPLVGRGRTLAAITFATGSETRSYTEADLAQAEEFARRAALVVDNVQLFERVELQRAQLEAQGEASPDGLLVVGSNAEILTHNRRFAEIWGFDDDVIAGGDEVALAAALDRVVDPDAFIARVRECYELRLASREELRFRDGRTIERYGAPVLGPDGDYKGYLWSFRDITDRKRIEEGEREARLRAELLERNAAHLAAAATVGEVAESTVADLEAVGFPMVAVVRLQGDTMATIASCGLPVQLRDRLESLTLSADLAVTEAMRTNHTMEFASGAEYDARYPGASEILGSHPVETIVAVPLRSADGRAIGALFAAAWEPDWLDERRRQLLHGVVEQCGLALERAELFEREHEVALTLQRSLLPRRLPARDALELSAVYRPGSQGLNVGGDWYDALALPDGRVALAIGDVVGHGLEAATVMGELRNSMRPLFLEGLRPGEILGRVNALAQIAAGLPATDPAFATCAVVLLDPGTGRIELSSAGHPPPLLVDASGRASFLEPASGPPIAAVETFPYGTSESRLEPGATLVLFTDGLVERRGLPLESGFAELSRAAEEAHAASVDDLCSLLVDRLVGDREIADDVAILVARVDPRPLFRRRIRARPEELASLRVALRDWLGGAGVNADAIYDVVLAMTEACANAMEHPVGRRSRTIEIDARIDDGTLTVDVRNSGAWRSAGPPGRRGRGLLLIRAFMDDVTIERSAETTTVHMTRALGSRR